MNAPKRTNERAATAAQLQHKAQRMLSQARIDMLLTMRFHGALAMRLNFAPRVQETALATDGRTLFYNPAKVVEWTHSRTVASMAQAVLHCAHGHPWRMGHRDPKKWSRAADLAVNHLLVEDGFDVPKEWCLDYQYQGMSAEVIYSRLIDDPGSNDQGEASTGDGSDEQPDDGTGSGGSGYGEDPAGVEKPQPPGDGSQSQQELGEALEAEWQGLVAQAAAQAKARGDAPASMRSAVGEMDRPRGDWRNELRHVMQALSADDYSWRMPSSRYLARGLYLPKLRNERLDCVVFVRDTSGSVTDDTLAKANAEIAAAIDECKPKRFIVIDCDAMVQRVWEMEDGDPMPDLKMAHGRGGTSFIPPFDWLAKEDIEPSALIYLTDLEGGFPTPPAYETIWVSCTRAVAPFGKTLHLL
jgi:predicted metal-dependent peptidase